jgi:hypothetical protein
MRLTSITINPPKIFMFNDREQAQDFFEEYINDVDVIDLRCKNGNEVVHLDYCTCGIIEVDEDENPVLFYNKKNQIFLLEHGPQVFLPPQELKNDIKNMNLTNSLLRKCKKLSKEQRKRYIELGKYCEECSANSKDQEDSDKEDSSSKDGDSDKEEVCSKEEVSSKEEVCSKEEVIDDGKIAKGTKVTKVPKVTKVSKAPKVPKAPKAPKVNKVNK